jgi:hypothetical protein
MTSPDIFENAHIDSGDDDTCEWVPHDMNPDWIPTNFEDISTEEIRTSVHLHLSILEDFDAENDSRYIRDAEVWAKSVFESAPDDWKQLFAAAWTEDQEYQAPFNCPSYWRPSLYLLHGPWMEAHGHSEIAVLSDYTSDIFREEDVPVEDQLLWPVVEYPDCDGCIENAPGQQSHMGPGGCIGEDSL